MLSIESSNVSSFSIYHIHKLSCPHRPINLLQLRGKNIRLLLAGEMKVMIFHCKLQRQLHSYRNCSVNYSLNIAPCFPHAPGWRQLNAVNLHCNRKRSWQHTLHSGRGRLSSSNAPDWAWLPDLWPPPWPVGSLPAESRCPWWPWRLAHHQSTTSVYTDKHNVV